MAVADAVRTTLGPRGMDKLVHNSQVRYLWRCIVLAAFQDSDRTFLIFPGKGDDLEWRGHDYEVIGDRPPCGQESCRRFFSAGRWGDWMHHVKLVHMPCRIYSLMTPPCLPPGTNGDSNVHNYVNVPVNDEYYLWVSSLMLKCHVMPHQVGDGTTSVVILAGEFLKEAKPFIEEGGHPRVGACFCSKLVFKFIMISFSASATRILSRHSEWHRQWQCRKCETCQSAWLEPGKMRRKISWRNVQWPLWTQSWWEYIIEN